MNRQQTMNWALPVSATANVEFFRQRLAGTPLTVMAGESWDAMAHADVSLPASGTVTVEAALLGAPMVTYYRVSAATWFVGRPLVKVPFYSMVNLIAGRGLVPELIQDEMTGERIAAEAMRLLRDPAARADMLAGLAQVRERLAGGAAAPERAAAIVEQILEGQNAHVS